MKTQQSLLAVGAIACLLALGSAPTLLGCPNDPRADRIHFTATDVPTGEFFDFGNYLTVTPDADGILRIRGVVMGDLFTLTIPELGVSNLAVKGRMQINADLDIAAGFTGHAWGGFEFYSTDENGNEVCVGQGFWHGEREKKSDVLWENKADIVGYIFAGPLAGMVIQGTEIIQTWHPVFATGYYGTAQGNLILLGSPDSCPPRHCPPRPDRH
jgi:hypothetical protein